MSGAELLSAGRDPAFMEFQTEKCDMGVTQTDILFCCTFTLLAIY